MDDDEEVYECDKFEDCSTCKFRREPWLFCEDDCEVGESYEEEDQEEVDSCFKGRL